MTLDPIDPMERHARTGRGLRNAREDLDLTMGDLADVLGVSVTRVSDCETGRVAWTPAMLRAHLAALVILASDDARDPDCTPDYLDTEPR